MHTVRPACYGLDAESIIVSVVGHSGLERAQALCGRHFSLDDLQRQIADMEDCPDRKILTSIAYIVNTARKALLEDTGSQSTSRASSASTRTLQQRHSP